MGCCSSSSAAGAAGAAGATATTAGGLAAPTPKTQISTTNNNTNEMTTPPSPITNIMSPKRATTVQTINDLDAGITAKDGALIGRPLCSTTLDARVKATSVFEAAHSKKGALSKKELRKVFYKINLSIPRDRLTVSVFFFLYVRTYFNYD
jgi:hypothetical protein